MGTHQRKPKRSRDDALAGIDAGGIGPIKRLKKMRQMRGIDARPVVPHLDDQKPGRGRDTLGYRLCKDDRQLARRIEIAKGRGDRNPPATRRIFHRIRNQVGDDRTQLDLVAEQHQIIRILTIDRDIFGRAQRAGHFRRLPQDASDTDTGIRSISVAKRSERT